MRCVDLYNQTQSKWFEEMVTTCMVTTRIYTAKSAVAMAAAAGGIVDVTLALKPPRAVRG